MNRRSQSRPKLTSTDRSPVIQAIAWLLLSILFLTLCLRLLTRFFLRRRFQYDDLLIAIAFVFALGQSVTLLVPQSNVWGKSLREIAPGALVSGLETQYAGGLLFIPSLCFAKLSVPVGLFSISPVMRHRQAIFALCSVIVAWTVTSELALAFQCRLPQPWNYVAGSCLDRQSLQLYIGIVNIITDLGLIILPIYIVAPLKMAIIKRLTVIAIFSARVTVIVATVTQLCYLCQSFTSNYTFSIFPYIICTQMVQTLSITTACIPYLQPFLDSLKSGHLWADDIQRHVQTPGVSRSYIATSNRQNYIEIESQSATMETGTELRTLRDKYESVGTARE